MGRHDRPDFVWTPVYRGYRCEGCEGFWATVQLEEGILLDIGFCLATEGCRGLVVALMPTDEPPPSDVPVYLEWYTPDRLLSARHYKINEHIAKGGLLARTTIYAPLWVDRKVMLR